jgi:hypothetical protein
MKLYAILVPECGRSGLEFGLEHHRAWDKKVCEIAGGVTIGGVTKGRWKSNKSVIFDDMIECKIACTAEKIIDVAKMTCQHYNQDAVFLWEVSSNAFVIERDSNVSLAVQSE